PWRMHGLRSTGMFGAEDRLLVRDRRQRPRAGAGRPDVRVDVHVDEARLAELHRMLERSFELLRARDREALHARRARPGREVRVVRLALRPLIEGSAVLAPVEVRVLQVADRRPGEVVPHNPDDGDVGFDYGAE